MRESECQYFLGQNRVPLSCFLLSPLNARPRVQGLRQRQRRSRRDVQTQRKGDERERRLEPSLHRKEIQVILLVKEVAVNEETTNRDQRRSPVLVADSALCQETRFFSLAGSLCPAGDQNKIPHPATSLPSSSRALLSLSGDFALSSNKASASLARELEGESARLVDRISSCGRRLESRRD